MYRRYGLIGKTITLKRASGESAAYPWGRLEIPVRIDEEYATFLKGTVLSHKHPRGFGPSKEYPITIDKHDVLIGEMIINGGEIR